MEERETEAEDRLIERAKDPPYDFSLVPECSHDMKDSVAVRIVSRRMCTFSIGEMFHLCNEAARRRSAQQENAPEPAEKRMPSSRVEANGAAQPDPPAPPRLPEEMPTLQIVAADPDTFEAGEIIQCPSCLKNMKAPMRARALRCANCRSEIHPKDRKSGWPSCYYQPTAQQGSPSVATTNIAASSTDSPVSSSLGSRPASGAALTGAGDEGEGDARSRTTRAGRSGQRGTGRLPAARTNGRGFDKPLSLDYIADRLDIDNPLHGYMIRHRSGGWLQGFILVTSFTTWQRWFRWDSLAPEAGLVAAHKDGDQSVWDHDGELTRQMESLPRSGDPEKEGVIWGRIAELSLLGGLKCGRFLLQLLIEEMEAGHDYDFLVLQATETSRSFYERMGFVRVGAVAKYVPPNSSMQACPTVGYRHWTFSDEPEGRMPEPSYMMARQLKRRRPKRNSVLATLDKYLVQKSAPTPLARDFAPCTGD